MSHLVVLVTVPNREIGKRLAEVLVEERLAACVNRVPGLLSIYRWQGKIEQEQEELLLIKTQDCLLEQLTVRVRELHPYTVPEIVALPVVGGSQAYLDWVTQETCG
jgi:periplasmic divalent cation tolerance protein